MRKSGPTTGIQHLIAQVAAVLSLSLCLILVSLPGYARETIIKGVRIWPSPQRTRIVFATTRPVQHRIFSLSKPDRLVIDIDNTRLGTSFKGLSYKHTPIREMRAVRHHRRDLRIVLSLEEPVKPRSFVLKPVMQYGNRLVVDLYTPEQLKPVVRNIDQITDQRRNVVVAIDAGHGGEDPGAIGPHHLYEKNITLAIARDMDKLFKKAPGFTPLMTRTGDYYVPLRERTEIARKNKADVFVSIHADKYKNALAQGASVYALSERGATSEEARWLAKSENSADLIGGTGSVSLGDKTNTLASVLLDLSMTHSISASLKMGQDVLQAIKPISKLHQQHVEQAAFVVLKSPDIPSILVETGYISNPVEARMLRLPAYREKMAKAIFRGIRHYIDTHPPPGTYVAWKERRAHEKLRTYQIVQGDTLSGIASKYRVSEELIRRVNGLSSNTIRIGQVLKIPAS